MEVRILRVIGDPSWQEALWQIYDRSFQEDILIYPHDQRNYKHRDAFLEVLLDDTIINFLLVHEGTPIGFSIVVDDKHPEHAPWSNFLAFKERAKGEEGTFHYINVIAIDPDYQKKGIGLELMDAMAEWGAGRLIWGFDAPREKHYLVELIRQRCQVNGLTLERIGSQDYYLISPQEQANPRASE